MEKTLLKTVSGVEVYVTSAGKIEATVGSQRISRASLRDLEREIGKRTAKVQAIRIVSIGPYGDHTQGPDVVQVAGKESGQWRLGDGSLTYAPLYCYDETILSQMQTNRRNLAGAKAHFEAIRDELNTAFRELTEQLTRLNDAHLMEKARLAGEEEVAG